MQSIKRQIKLTPGDEKLILEIAELGKIEIKNGALRRIANDLTKKSLTKIVQIYDENENKMKDVIELTEEGQKIATKLLLRREITRGYEIAQGILHKPDIDEKEINKILEEIEKLVVMTKDVNDVSERKKAIRVIYIMTKRTLPRIRIR